VQATSNSQIMTVELVYIKGMKLVIKNSSLPKITGTLTALLIVLFIVSWCFDSVKINLLVWLFLIIVNGILFFEPENIIKKGLKSIKEFNDIQNSTIVFFLLEFILSLIAIFVGFSEISHQLITGGIMIIMSLIGVVQSVLLKDVFEQSKPPKLENTIVNAEIKIRHHFSYHKD
jgi:hypothetical protein